MLADNKPPEAEVSIFIGEEESPPWGDVD